MHPKSERWEAVTPSEFPWEREALEYVRQGLPDHEPYQAWSNFEFVAGDGFINEVDLLVLAPSGFYLIEIKSNRGAVYGDAGTWSWRFDGKETVMDNPLLLANRKAKRLKSLLQRQPSARKTRLPFLQAVVFLAATDLTVKLDRSGRQAVWVRDEKVDRSDPDAVAGILTQLKEPGGGRPSSVTSKQKRALRRAMQEAGIRRSQRARRLGDYVLDAMVSDGESYQDWTAHHRSMEELTRRVRIYPVAAKAGRSRETVARAVRRELRILEGIHHPGILRPLEYKEHDLGPALLFEHHPAAQRLDHYLTKHGPDLSFETRLQLFRELAEILQVAHEKRLYHRALSPQNILVVDPEAPHPRLQIFNWQTGVREATTSGAGRAVTGTAHPDQLVESAATAYLAPEVREHPQPNGETADVFSLGAIAYHLFTGQPPAANGLELHQRLHAEKEGLRPAATANGIPESLDYLVAFSTAPQVATRLQSVEEVLDALEAVEDDFTSPFGEMVDDPDHATVGDVLEGGYRVVKRIGQGSSSIAFLVEHGERELVLKLARNEDQNSALRGEAEVLDKLRHQNIVELHGTVDIYGRVGLLLTPIGLARNRGGDRDNRQPRTLAEEIHRNGPPALDLLHRFGEDLLQAVKHLEEQGIPHRDIKPDNLGIQPSGPNDALHLVLFDFSLARAPAENLHVGTRPYLDPFLEERKVQRWDLAAERFSAAMTLYEMTTGTLPTWGDGETAIPFTEGEAHLDTDLFTPEVRKPLTEFFSIALRRDAGERFANADEMYRAWSRAFEAADQPALPVEAVEPTEPERDLVADAELATQVIELGLSTRALNALEREGVATVEDLLAIRPGRLIHQRGVGDKTRKEVADVHRRLRSRFPDVARVPETGAAEEGAADESEALSGAVSVDRLAAALLPGQSRQSNTNGPKATCLYLGLEAGADVQPWCTQSEVARQVGVTRARVGQYLAGYRRRWRRMPTLTTLREEIAEILDLHGGVMTGPELERSVLTARGSAEGDDARRLADARAVSRAALEVERALERPRWSERRSGDRLLVVREPAAESDLPTARARADYAKALGAKADELAAQDPLPSPTVVVRSLQEVPEPLGAAPLPHARLVRLAAAVSDTAAASPRLELYPRGLPAARALSLSATSLLGAGELTPQDVRQRVRTRFPESEDLPGRPELDELLTRVQLAWNEDAKNGQGAYTTPGLKSWTSTSSYTSMTLSPRPGTPPEVREAQEFESKLVRAKEQGQYLLLAVTRHRHLEKIAHVLHERHDLPLESLDRLLIRALKTTAEELGADWDVVLAADASDRESRDWRRLQQLLERALPKVEAEILSHKGTLVLTHPGLLARYDRLEFLERFREAVGRRRQSDLEGLWILMPDDDQTDRPRLDGKAMPVVTNDEWIRVPPSWPSRLDQPDLPADAATLPDAANNDPREARA